LVAAGELGIWTTNQKLAFLGIGLFVVMGVTLVAFRVSRCRRGLWNYGRATTTKRPLDASFYKAKAARQGCDWPEKLSW